MCIRDSYYDIILGARYTHIEASDYTTVDGSQENYIIGNKVDKVDGDYSVAIKKGRFNVSNPTGTINLLASDMTIMASETLTSIGGHVIVEKKSSSEHTVGDEKKTIGGKFKLQTGATSLNAQGSIGLQAGGGLSINATDSINESIFGVLPGMTMGYAKKTTATLGKIGMESTDNLLSGGIEMNLGLAGLGASIALKPLGDIELISTLGLSGITASTKLGNIQLSSLLSTFKLTTAGAAMMQGLLGEVSVGTTGKIKVSSPVATLGEILKKLIEIIGAHTHPTGTGPSGPPLPPATVDLKLLSAIKIAMSLE